MTSLGESRFQVLTHSFDNHLLYELIDTKSRESVSILPFLGGAINSYRILKGSSLVETIDGYLSLEDIQDNLESSFKGINLFPFPNRIAGGRYNFMQDNFQLPVNFQHEDNAIHGLVFDKPFTVLKLEDGDTRCSLTLSFTSEGQTQGYPFCYTLSHEYIFDLNRGFRCTTKIHNNSKTEMPAGHGWHPYFTLGANTIDELKLCFPAREILEMNTVNIPTGQTFPYNQFPSPVPLPVADTELDSCFLLIDREEKANIILRNDQLDLQLRIWQETGPGKYNYLQVYTPPHRKSIAIEPMTCAPDAFNNKQGLLTIAPDEEVAVSWGMLRDK